MITTCPRCLRADDVSYQRLQGRTAVYTCADDHSGDGAHTWVRAGDEGDLYQDARAGATDELLEPLAACVLPHESFAEYGVIEYRFRQRHPDLFAHHVRELGHVLLGPKPYTATSVRFGVALSRLARSGDLVSRYGPATGAWSDNGQITYWAAPPASPGEPLTWETFCAETGRSPEWTDDDRIGLT